MPKLYPNCLWNLKHGRIESLIQLLLPSMTRTRLSITSYLEKSLEFGVIKFTTVMRSLLSCHLTKKTLEIGPFAKPSVVGPTVKYADIRSTKELRELALVTEGMNPEDVPKINWVVPSCDLSVINEKFDAVISSHCIEHQPDLIKHLNQVENLLEADGRYFLLIPDHRYCFDHFKVPSSISDVLTASLEKRSTHSVLHRLNSQLFNAHNNPIKHWNGNHEGQEFDTEFPSLNRLQQIKKVVREYQEEGERIKDEHAWFFTPSTFTSIINELNDLEILNLKIERIYPTLRNSNEFWAVLRT